MFNLPSIGGSPMVPVQQVIPDTLAHMLRKAPLSSEKVAFAWRMAVGPAVDQATRIALRENVLHVHARGVEWRREIERNAALVRSRLDALLGSGVVRYIEIS
jgi:hypothetical protein